MPIVRGSEEIYSNEDIGESTSIEIDAEQYVAKNVVLKDDRLDDLLRYHRAVKIELEDEIWCRLKIIVLRLPVGPAPPVLTLEDTTDPAAKTAAAGHGFGGQVEGVIEAQVLPCLKGEVERGIDEGMRWTSRL